MCLVGVVLLVCRAWQHGGGHGAHHGISNQASISCSELASRSSRRPAFNAQAVTVEQLRSTCGRQRSASGRLRDVLHVRLHPSQALRARKHVPLCCCMSLRKLLPVLVELVSCGLLRAVCPCCLSCVVPSASCLLLCLLLLPAWRCCLVLLSRSFMQRVSLCLPACLVAACCRRCLPSALCLRRFAQSPMQAALGSFCLSLAILVFCSAARFG